MKALCFYCNRDLDTQEEEVVVSVGWGFDEMLAKNNLKVDKPTPRMLYLCSACWNNSFKEKPQAKDSYWIYDRST